MFKSEVMKKLLKILAWLAGIVAVLLILLVVAAKLFLPADKIRDMAVEQASARLDREVTIADLDVSFWGGLGVKLVDVTVASPEQFETGDLLTADNIDVKLQLFPLLSGEYRIDRLIVNSPRIVMKKNADGSANYVFPSIDEQLPADIAEGVSPETKAAAAAVTFDRLEINDGQLEYFDDSSGLSLRLVGLDLQTSLDIPRENVYQSSGRIAVDSLLVVMDDSLPSFAVDLQYRADYDMARKEIMLHESELAINGLEFKLTSSLDHTESATRGRTSVRSKEIQVADLFGLLPPEQLAALEGFDFDGAFSLDVDLSYDESKTEPLSYSGSAVITDLEMTGNDIPGKLKFRRALVDFEVDNLRMNIEDGSFDGRPLTGRLTVNNFDDPSVSGELAGRLNLAFVEPFLPAEGEHRLTGEMEFDTKFSGLVSRPTEMEFSGDLSIENGSYQSNLLPEPIQKFSLDIFVDNSLTRVRGLSLETAGGNLSFSGRINNLAPYLMADSSEAQSVTPSMDGAIKGSLSLAMLNRFLDQQSHPQMAGRLEMDIKLTGSADQFSNFKPRGSLSLADASYNDDNMPEPIEHLRVDLLITPDTITVQEMQVKFTSSDVSFTGKLIDPFPYLLPLEIVDQSRVKKPIFIFELSSQRLNLDSLFPEAVPGSGVNRSSLPADSVPPIILPDINGRGRFSIDTLIYSQVEFSNIKGKAIIKDRKITCHDVTGNVYTGEVEGNTTIDLTDFENPVYQGKFQAKQIEADDFVSRFSKMGGFLFGKIDLNGSYDARGWEPEQFLNSLSMNGKMDMNDGKLRTSGATYELVSNLASQFGETFAQEQTLKNATTNIVVKDGRVGIDKLTTALGDLGDLELGGYYSFDGGLNYQGSLLLSKERSQKLLGGLSSFFGSDNGGRVRLPLSIGGTMNSPKLNLDISAIKDNLGDDLKKKAEGLLKDLF